MFTDCDTCLAYSSVMSHMDCLLENKKAFKNQNWHEYS